MTSALLPVALVDPDRETARRWAVEELSDPVYVQAQPGLVQQVLSWALEQLQRLLDAAGGASSGIGLAVGLALVAVVVVAAVLLAGPLRRRGAVRRRGSGGVFGATTMTAAQHRAAAEQAAAAGRWAAAVQERFRATARSLEERVVLDARPGRTAGEVATEGGTALPDAAGGLARAARVFDDVTYGERAGDEAGYSAVVAADEAVRRSRPVATAAVGGVR